MGASDENEGSAVPRTEFLIASPVSSRWLFPIVPIRILLLTFLSLLFRDRSTL